MIFRAAFLSAISACLVCASDQTLLPGAGKQPANAGDAALLQMLKAASSESLGINRPSHAPRLGSNFTLDITPWVQRANGPLLLVPQTAPISMARNFCAIPLTPMHVQSTHDAIGQKSRLNYFDPGIAVPAPPTCPTK